MPEVAALYRLSDRKQTARKNDEEPDIPGQRIAVANFLKTKPDWRLVLEYEEKGVSAFKNSADDRDTVQDALRDARAGKFSILVVFKSDRLSRRSLEYPAVLAAFLRMGVEVWSVTGAPGGQRLSLDNQTDKLLRFIEGWQAETESVNTSIRVRERMRQVAESGRWIGGRVPFGYKLVAELDGAGQPILRGGRVVRHLVPHPEHAPIVRELFRRYLSGQGAPQLAGWLNAIGAPSFWGRGWEESGVKKLLRNKLYVGLLEYKRGQNRTSATSEYSVTKGVHDAIVDDGLFEQVQRAMALRSRIPKRQLSIPYLLAGIAWCECGRRIGSITRAWTTKAGGENRYQEYRCYEQKRGGCPSGMRSVRAKVIDGLFLQFLSEIDTPEKMAGFLSGRSTEQMGRARDVADERRTIKDKIAKLESALKDLDRSYFVEKDIERDQYKERQQEYKAELGQLRDRLADINTADNETDFAKLAELVAGVVATWEDLAPLERRTLAMDVLDMLGAKAVITPDSRLRIEFIT